jgi:hypothetical protein
MSVERKNLVFGWTGIVLTIVGAVYHMVIKPLVDQSITESLDGVSLEIQGLRDSVNSSNSESDGKRTLISDAVGKNTAAIKALNEVAAQNKVQIEILNTNK